MPKPAPDLEDDHTRKRLIAITRGAGDQLRLEILRLLARDSFAVQELADILRMAQPALSHHLKVLASADLVSTRREGNSVYYRRQGHGRDDAVTTLKRTLFDTIDTLPLRAESAAGIARIHDRRKQAAQIFFARHAEEFRSKQDLIASFGQLEGLLGEALEHAGDVSRALEVGPGDGQLLAMLKQRFNKVVALDQSPEMISLARNRFPRGTGIEFINKDLATYAAGRARFQLIAMNMVLHHMPSPAQCMAQVARLLSADGAFLLLDLTPHDQDWVRDACGDQWQGFAADDVEQWARGAGLNSDYCSYLALRNGFQVQCRLLRKQAPANESIR